MGGHKTPQGGEMIYTEMAPMWVMFAEQEMFMDSEDDENSISTYLFFSVFLKKYTVHLQPTFCKSQRPWHFELRSYGVIGSDHTFRRQIYESIHTVKIVLKSHSLQ